MVVDVGATLATPRDATSVRGATIRVPALVTIARRELRGRIELRRCKRTKAHSARSCARPRQYTVIAARRATRSRQVAFAIRVPPSATAD